MLHLLQIIEQNENLTRGRLIFFELSKDLGKQA
jgi:hypothetical protein